TSSDRDWSSDVCSSDLLSRADDSGGLVNNVTTFAASTGGDATTTAAGDISYANRDALTLGTVGGLSGVSAPGRTVRLRAGGAIEIGRASCRERAEVAEG